MLIFFRNLCWSFPHFPLCVTALWAFLPMHITSIAPSRAVTSVSLSPDPIVYVRNQDITFDCFIPHILDNQILLILPPNLASLFVPSFCPHCHSLSAGFQLHDGLLSSLLASTLVSFKASSSHLHVILLSSTSYAMIFPVRS